MTKDKYICFDWAMKRMLRDKANFVVLEGLLIVLLEHNKADTTAPGLVEVCERLKCYNMSLPERHVYDKHVNRWVCLSVRLRKFPSLFRGD